MIRSMTGFGKATGAYTNRKITVEIRSLNSKQLDLNVRIPNFFKEKEMELKSLVAEKVERGKVDVVVYYENLGEERAYSINKALALSYFKELNELKEAMGVKTEEDVLSSILRLPDVVSSEKKEMDENEWKTILQIANEAMTNFISFRVAEGDKLKEDLKTRVAIILDFLNQTESFEKERMESIKQRMQKALQDNFAQENIDRNRFEQELIYYLERLDVSEEKMRLRTHCDYFVETMEKENQQGRKLGFISQEMGREINTLGSKSNHAEMQKLVVVMKDELEKIKEQVLNVL